MGSSGRPQSDVLCGLWVVQLELFEVLDADAYAGAYSGAVPGPHGCAASAER